ncbi:hypothetical protein BFQ14_24660 [Escherichia coli]|nr:hypothetical protein BFQ14_24660 [Escherichia coli]
MLAFLLILLPLLVLAWQAWQSLNALSDQAALVNRTTLIDARRSEAMTNAALEMERSYRQYCVLDDPTLAKVYQTKYFPAPGEKVWHSAPRNSGTSIIPPGIFSIERFICISITCRHIFKG